MNKHYFDLQLFAEEGTEHETEPVSEPAEGGKEAKEEKKYTDAEVDKLLERKFAEWQKKQDKKTSEAERLGRMTAEEKANERMQALEKRIAEYEQRESRAEMTKQARSMLNDKNIHVGDELLSNLIAEDAETTKASVESFINLFSAAVENGIKDALKGEAPKAGGSSNGMTKEQILAIPNRAERQQKIKENINLFK